jgi:4-carboxymuconolactone decarboxylase
MHGRGRALRIPDNSCMEGADRTPRSIALPSPIITPIIMDDTMTNRLLELAPGDLTAEQTTVFDRLTAGRGRILGPYKVWIHSPTVASGMEHIGTYLNKRSTLSTREVEIGILVIARHWQSQYVIQAHIRDGRKAGLSDEIIDAVLAGTDPKLTDPHERAMHGFATALVANKTLSDEEFAAIEQVLGRDGVAEVLVLLGYYTSVAMAMRVHDVPPPPLT